MCIFRLPNEPGSKEKPLEPIKLPRSIGAGVAMPEPGKGQVLGVLRGHKSIVTWCAFSPDDQFIYSCSFDGSVRKWQSATGDCMRVGDAHSDSVLDADLSPNGKRLVSCGMDGTIRMWDTHAMASTHRFKGHHDGTWIKAVCFARDGRRVLSAGLDKRLILWDQLGGVGHPDEPRPKEKTAGALRIVDGAHTDFILAVACHTKHAREKDRGGGAMGTKRGGVMNAAAVAAATLRASQEHIAQPLDPSSSAEQGPNAPKTGLSETALSRCNRVQTYCNMYNLSKQDSLDAF